MSWNGWRTGHLRNPRRRSGFRRLHARCKPLTEQDRPTGRSASRSPVFRTGRDGAIVPPCNCVHWPRSAWVALRNLLATLAAIVQHSLRHRALRADIRRQERGCAGRKSHATCVIARGCTAVSALGSLTMRSTTRREMVFADRPKAVCFLEALHWAGLGGDHARA